ncbi:MAG: sodium:proton antiporter [Candidatus Diapherotrites archaeon]|uniref:Sodium:proton antiporter n=1 Tax=Candidatus Iainarchaeum sp. TaxID=3101447 RepID=A0A939C4A9_9ARCH|nr:sodium:proton antiporter [Candidatus Diapherotrites archaeon]
MDKPDTGLSPVVKTIAYIVAVPIATFGFYIALHGHLTPGGGFAGGAIVATITALFLVAFGRSIIKGLHAKAFSSLRTLKNIGITAFGLLVLASLSATFLHRFLTSSTWFFQASIPFGANPGELGTAGAIPIMNIFVGLEVTMGLSLAVILLLVIGEEKECLENSKARKGGQKKMSTLFTATAKGGKAE